MGNLSVPPWITPEVILLAAGLVVAIASFFVAYRKLKPGLRVFVARCTHKVRYAGPGKRSGNIAGTEVVVTFEIGNKGGRTSIYQVQISCKPFKQEYRTTERVEPAIVIDPGQQTTFTHQFYIPKREVSETLLDCTFFLHHTHGKKKVKARSNLRER